LRIALALKDDDILDILALVDFRLSKHELSAFFRAPTHRQSRQCKDQVLRNFLNGMQKRYRKSVQEKHTSTPPKPKRTILSLRRP